MREESYIVNIGILNKGENSYGTTIRKKRL